MDTFKKGKIHPSALISKNAKIGIGITIGPFSIIHDNVVIGDSSIIGPHCILGEPTSDFYSDNNYSNPLLEIGKNSLIRTGTTIYAGSQIGNNFETGHRVTIREKSKIGDNVRIGTLSDIQGHCHIGSFVRFHSNVHIGQKSKIRDFVWIFPYVVLTNDPQPPSETILGIKIEEFAVIASMSTILPGVIIGKNSLVGAHSLVRKNVPRDTVVFGNPAKVFCKIKELKSKKGDRSHYPWQENFSRGMPWERVGFKNWSKNKG
jgi:acetyltransferase-like isoleucine patch superfamily enzyme